MKKFLAIFIILTTFIIDGCTSSSNNNIDKVKNGIMNFDKSITVSQAFDNWKSCSNNKWSEFKTDNGKNVVEFTCDSNNFQRYIQQAKNTYSKVAYKDKIAKQEEKEKHIILSKKFRDEYNADLLKLDSQNMTDDYKYKNIQKKIKSNDKSLENTIKNFNKSIEIDENVLSKIFSIKSSKYIIQWVVNIDDTFEINYFGIKSEWNDGKTYNKSLPITMALQKVYANETLLSNNKITKIDNYLDTIDTRLKEKYKSQYLRELTLLKEKIIENVFTYFNYAKAE